MYVDEVGNPDLQASLHPNHRYLSLTGVIFELGYVERELFPRLEALKAAYFGSHPDEPVILHRKELVNQRPPFSILNGTVVKSAFDHDLLDLLLNLDYKVATTVIDKQQHLAQYATWRFDPYHYCMMVLVERYILWLQETGSVGDVMAESRGGREDIRLKDSFNGIFHKGTSYVRAAVLQKHLTSGQLKVKAKSNNIAGLQVADLIAHPSQAAMIAQRENRPLPTNFGGLIYAILDASKYLRKWNGRVDGWGRKWLP